MKSEITDNNNRQGNEQGKPPLPRCSARRYINPFEVNPTDTITYEKAQVAKELIEQVQVFCESNLTDSYEVSHKAYAKGIRVDVDATDDVQKLLRFQDT